MKYFYVFVIFIFTIFCKAQSSKYFVVVIDPGHGGKDVGAMSLSKKVSYEKDVALDVGLLLGKYLKNIPNVKVLYTRKTDVFIELQERSKFANRNKADLFISIHCNANKNSQAHGCETFVIGTSKNHESLEVAKRENAVIELEENYEEKYQGFDPNSIESLVGLTLFQNKYLENSLSFSNYLQQEFEHSVGRKNRGVKQGPWWVISHNTMPSVLIELGFLTNKKEEQFLISKKGKRYMAKAILKAFKKYKTDIDARRKKLNKEKKKVVNNIIYKVQFISSDKKININKFKNLKKVDYYKQKGIYKYTCYATKSYKQVLISLKMVRKKGYKGAFIIVFKNGKRVSLKSIKQKK